MTPLTDPGLRVFLAAVATATILVGGGVHAQPGDEAPFDSTITMTELLSKARDAFGLEKLDLAEEFYQEMLRREPTNLRAMLELANVYERNGKLENARGLLTRASRLAPDVTDIIQRRNQVDHVLSLVLTEEIDALMGRGDFEKAIPKLSLFQTIDPGNPELLFKRAKCLAETGSLDAALGDLEKAIKIEPKEEFYELRNGVAARLKQKGTQFLKAKARELAQSNAPTDHEEALKLLGQVLKIEPENEWAKSEFRRLSESDPPVGDGNVVEAERVTEELQGLGAKTLRALQRHVALLVGFLAIILIFKSPLTSAIVKAFSSRPLLSGQLSKFSLPEILLMLNAEPHTGVLNVRGHGVRGKVYFEGGEPCHCLVGKIDGIDALIDLINHSDSGHFDFAEGSLPAQRSIDKPLSLILIEQARTKSPKSISGGKKSKMKELLESKTV